MKLINTDGLAIFGPGSEWFWSMAQFVVVVATLVGIYRQLGAQRAASLYEQSAAWNRDWNDEHLRVSRLALMLDLEGRPADAGLPRSVAETGDYFERLGYLVVQGHLRSVDVWNDLRLAVGNWWTLLAPYIRHERTTSGNPSLYEWFEKLELEMERLDRKMLGRALNFDVSAENQRLSIEHVTARLQLHADAKTGVFPSRRTDTPGTDPRDQPQVGLSSDEPPLL